MKNFVRVFRYYICEWSIGNLRKYDWVSDVLLELQEENDLQCFYKSSKRLETSPKLTPLHLLRK